MWNLFKVNKKTPERFDWPRSGVFIAKFETDFTQCTGVSVLKFEQVMPAGYILTYLKGNGAA